MKFLFYRFSENSKPRALPPGYINVAPKGADFKISIALKGRSRKMGTAWKQGI
jgi:hypothetical protein